ncbi:unnamed protein product [Echinostoma caproni]|uniref:Uncharacterized protein n=1 Tax=Echinostoma caproni TaxID=27848 RepID=A0A183AU03_9TREM|nr:unnamed protein product [Echinostoma caproni]
MGNLGTAAYPTRTYEPVSTLPRNNTFKRGTSVVESTEKDHRPRAYATVQHSGNRRARPALRYEDEMEFSHGMQRTNTFGPPPEEQQWIGGSFTQSFVVPHIREIYYEVAPQMPLNLFSYSTFSMKTTVGRTNITSNSPLDLYNSYSNELNRMRDPGRHSGREFADFKETQQQPHRQKRNPHDRYKKSFQSVDNRKSLTTFGIPQINSEAAEVRESRIPRRTERNLRATTEAPLQSWLRTEETGVISQDWEI